METSVASSPSLAADKKPMSAKKREQWEQCQAKLQAYRNKKKELDLESKQQAIEERQSNWKKLKESVEADIQESKGMIVQRPAAVGGELESKASRPATVPPADTSSVEKTSAKSVQIRTPKRKPEMKKRPPRPPPPERMEELEEAEEEEEEDGQAQEEEEEEEQERDEEEEEEADEEDEEEEEEEDDDDDEEEEIYVKVKLPRKKRTTVIQGRAVKRPAAASRPARGRQAPLKRARVAYRTPPVHAPTPRIERMSNMLPRFMFV